jgi:type IV pilus assembly protein PilW
MKKNTGQNLHLLCHGIHSRPYGFSLVELLIAMAISLLLLGAIYSVFTFHNKTFSHQEQIVDMLQNVRMEMDTMSREVRMAGYDPTGVNSDPNPANNFSGITVDLSLFQIQADLNGNGTIDNTSQENPENIVYAFDAANKRITRNIGAGPQSFIDDVDSFTFEYLDGNGNGTPISSAVRQVRLKITGRTAKPDPAYTANSGYRTYELKSIATLRN